MPHLVVVESPAKCKKIASFLGSNFIVLATMGHIRALEEDIDAVGIDRDFEPRFKFLSEKSKATKPIMDAAKKCDIIYLAADDDREGEAIAYAVACLLKKDPLTLPRAVFHEITREAVCNAVANPRRLDMNRVYAQQARAVLDMLVGFTISPLLWKHVARGLSAGRCQTPALRLVSDREKEITGHTSETTWGLSGNFKANEIEFPASMEELAPSKGGSAPCHALTFSASMEDELEDQESAMNYLESVHEDSKATVVSAENRPWMSNPPKPLITSTLQQEASALHKLNPKSTMKIAQTLYEAGHITYMRTDHAILSEEAIVSAQAEVKKVWGQEFVGDASAARATAAAKVSKKTKKSEGDSPAPQAQAQELTSKAGKQSTVQQQEAHEAIRPTHFELRELPSNEDWNPVDKKVYHLIWRRAIQSCMSPAKGQTRIAKLILAGDDDSTFPWTSSWRTTDFQGWQIAGQNAKLDETEDDEPSDSSGWKAAQKITQGSTVNWTQLQAAPKRSRASPRYTEATLIRELERKGIGRPSTFASLVEILFDKLYVEKQDITGQKLNHTTLTIKPTAWPPLTQVTQVAIGAEKQKLVPTALGESVLTFCLREFPQLFSYDFTATMEARLDQVSKGEEVWKQLCRDTWTSYKDSYARLKDKANAPSNSEKVQDFGNGFKAVMSKQGPLLVQETDGKAKFYSFPVTKGVTIQTITEEQARAHIDSLQQDAVVGSWDGKPIEKKKGPYGIYLQCGELRIPFNTADTQAQIVEKFAERSKNVSDKYVFGPYTFGKGQYGQYMYKTELKTKVFVGLPDSLDVKKLTGEEADKLYKVGVEAKKTRGGGRGGGGRGGGGFRGRGGGGRGGATA
jgi:DNA topoisomerase-1